MELIQAYLQGDLFKVPVLEIVSMKNETDNVPIYTSGVYPRTTMFRGRTYTEIKLVENPSIIDINYLLHHNKVKLTLGPYTNRVLIELKYANCRIQDSYLYLDDTSMNINELRGAFE